MHRYDKPMSIYTVHIPPEGGEEKARFLAEGVNFWALIVPFFWLLWHRLWLAFLAYIAAVGIIIGIGRIAGEAVTFLLAFLPGLFLMFEGNQLIRNRLSRQGWQLVDVVSGARREDAELAFFNSLNPAVPPQNAVQTMPRATQTSTGAASGTQAQRVRGPAATAKPSGIGIFQE